MRMLLAAAIAASVSMPGQPAGARKGEHFSAVLTAGPLSAAPVPIEIGVDRWSTDETRASLFDIFQSGGPDALLAALKKAPVAGYVRARSRERLTAQYVQEEARSDGGRRVLLLCVRVPGDWEVTRESGWTDHLYRIVALTLDSTGHGTGMLFHTAKITFGRNGPDLVSELSGQPTKLLSVQALR